MIKSAFWSAILDAMVFSMNERQPQFSFCQLLMFCIAFASATTRGMIASAVLIRKWCLVMLTLWKNKPNTSSIKEQKHSFQPS